MAGVGRVEWREAGLAQCCAPTPTHGKRGACAGLTGAASQGTHSRRCPTAVPSPRCPWCGCLGGDCLIRQSAYRPLPRPPPASYAIETSRSPPSRPVLGHGCTSTEQGPLCSHGHNPLTWPHHGMSPRPAAFLAATLPHPRRPWRARQPGQASPSPRRPPLRPPPPHPHLHRARLPPLPPPPPPSPLHPTPCTTAASSPCAPACPPHPAAC